MFEQLKGYKSVLFFALMLVIAIANLLGLGDFSMTEQQSEILAVVVPLVGLGLRYLTDSPIFEKSAG